MSALKTAAITGLVIAAGVGLLFATGVVSLRSGEAQDDSHEEPPEEPAAKGGKKGKKKRGKRRKKGKRNANSDLDALGYLGNVQMRPQDVGKKGVVTHDEAKTTDGLHLLTIAPGPKNVPKMRKAGQQPHEVRLMDMTGKVVHTWQPDYPPAPNNNANQWAVAKIGPDGSLYVVHTLAAMVKMGWDSSLQWRSFGEFHHDFTFSADGSQLLVLDERVRHILVDDAPMRIKDNGVTFIDVQTGKVDREYWFWDRFSGREDVDKALRKHRRAKKAYDLFHVNNVEVLSQPLEGVWETGDLLVCLRNLNVLAVLDAETLEPKWEWGTGELDRPHDPTLLSNGHIIVLDNGFYRGDSRVLEIDPANGNEVVWMYEGTEEQPFWTKTRGLVQVTPQDTVVINSTQQARTFEVDRQGTILWEYFIPDTLPGGNDRVAFRSRRLLGSELETARQRLSR